VPGSEEGRDDLARWRAARPDNYYDATPNLARGLALHAGASQFGAMEPRLRAFGHVVATGVEPAVVSMERHRQLPAHVPSDAIGRPLEAVEFHPDHTRAGEAVWASGLLALPHDGSGDFERVALFYLLSHAGEGGHACPVVCTVGLARAVERRGPSDLRARFGPGLQARHYDTCTRGSQFLTEVQGGSDVGANAARAVPDPAQAGAWRISGEKWFCSVADADVFAVTARPDGAPAGTRGLGCFLVPRTVDGAPNGFRIRRLKDKLGTRALASAEIDFDGALAWPIGPVHDGFRVAVEDLLNTSRWLNAVGSTGLMRRACLEAASFARHRRAFGRAVGSFPAVREQLAVMKTEEQAALASTLALTALHARLDDAHGAAPAGPGAAGPGGAGPGPGADAGVFRVLVNANKYVTSTAATDVVRRGIEVLGGNGTIEDFSALPRLYRDAMVYESWEGTHNVLCAQVQRDCARLGLLDDLLPWVRATLAAAGEGAGAEGRAVGAALDVLEPRLRRSVEDAEHAAAHFRRQLDQLMRAVQAACLLAEAAVEDGGTGKSAGAALFVRRHLVPGHDPEDDAGWRGLVDEALAGDAG